MAPDHQTKVECAAARLECIQRQAERDLALRRDLEARDSKLYEHIREQFGALSAQISGLQQDSALKTGMRIGKQEAEHESHPAVAAAGRPRFSWKQAATAVAFLAVTLLTTYAAFFKREGTSKEDLQAAVVTAVKAALADAKKVGP